MFGLNWNHWKTTPGFYSILRWVYIMAAVAKSVHHFLYHILDWGHHGFLCLELCTIQSTVTYCRVLSRTASVSLADRCQQWVEETYPVRGRQWRLSPHWSSTGLLHGSESAPRSEPSPGHRQRERPEGPAPWPAPWNKRRWCHWKICIYSNVHVLE